MPDPTKYARDFSFEGFQSGNPNSSQPGIRIDDELDNIATALGGAVDAIKDVRRSDGKLKNGVVTRESFSVGLANTLFPISAALPLTTKPLPAVSDGAALRAFGFVGDGDEHPLSELFPTLAAANVVFPKALSLTEQRDQHALQRLIDLELQRTSAGSCDIHVPAGFCMMHGPLKTNGLAHVKLIGAGIKATIFRVLKSGATFYEHGLDSAATGTLTLEEIQIENAFGNGGTAIDLDSLIAPSIHMRNVQVNGYRTVLKAMNIAASRFEKVRSYNYNGLGTEASRAGANAYVLRQTQGCFLNIWTDCQTEGHDYAIDILSTSQPGYEGHYFNGFNINSGTHVALIRSTVPTYDAPQWVFTDLEIEVSGSWFDLTNLASVSIDVDFGLTFQGSAGFSFFNLTRVVGAELNIDQLKTFSFPNYIFNLINGNAGVNARIGTLRIETGAVNGGLVFFGLGNSRCIERGLTLVTNWNYAIPFAQGPTARSDGNISVTHLKTVAATAGMSVVVDPFGSTPTLTLSGSTPGTVPNGLDFPVSFPAGIFQAVEGVVTCSGDAASGGEPVAPIFATIGPAGFTARFTGAPAGSLRRVNWIASGI